MCTEKQDQPQNQKQDVHVSDEHLVWRKPVRLKKATSGRKPAKEEAGWSHATRPLRGETFHDLENRFIPGAGKECSAEDNDSSSWPTKDLLAMLHKGG